MPITIIAHDPAVLDRIAGWGWQDGLQPEPAGAGLAHGLLPRPLPRRVQRRPRPCGRGGRVGCRVARRVLWRAREAAFPPGEFVGQESFMTAGEIRSLALHAGIAPGVSVLDLCCGAGGAGLFVTGELGCTYLGVDASPGSVAEARASRGAAAAGSRSRGSPSSRPDLRRRAAARDPARVPRQAGPRPTGRWRTPAGRALRLHGGGGPAPHRGEREVMPAAETVWLSPLATC